jgi:phosphohistidine phosphatase
MTARFLILTRHAKSDWGDLALPDHDRPLNTRGRAAAPLIGAYLRDKGVHPDIVLCSTARRTQDTWEGIAAQMAGPPDVILQRGLYNATSGDIAHIIAQAQGTCIMVIGHNPGIGDLAAYLAHRPVAHHDFTRYPTGATTVLRFDDLATWANLRPQSGKLQGFVTPRDLGG